MKIEKNKMVKIHYTLKDDEGKVIDSSIGKEALEYLHGEGMLIPGMERELENKEKGAKFTAVIEPKDGYGEYKPEYVVEVPRDRFDANAQIEVGQKFQAETPSGNMLVTVTKVTPENITIDSNHELAGKRLHFEVEVVDIRDATSEELSPYQYNESFGCSGGCGSCGGGCGGCGGGCE
ncbi:FKBP-type peptidyl-prolyl cis-trans isomerase [Treponema pectinovorum]|uniref:FKBP-type peptidyl-prolyl cis-trans isomerase n=1 Tax=Treponema pectinovorum TaxID=164 RepID=UPI003D917657